MPGPVTWGTLQMSQDDGRTIGEYVDDQLALHNVDPDAHMDASGSLATHRSQEELDHPELSVQPLHVANDITGVGRKSGTFPRQGQEWQQCSSAPNELYYTGCYLAPIGGGSDSYNFLATEDGDEIVTEDGDQIATHYFEPAGIYMIFGEGGVWATSPDGDTWTAQTPFTSNSVAYAFAQDGVAIVGTNIGSGAGLFVCTDGINFVAVTDFTNIACSGITHDGTDFWVHYIEDNSSGVVNRMWQTPDGGAGSTYSTDLEWQADQLACLPGVTYPFVAVSQNKVWVSTNCLTWIQTFFNTDHDVLFITAGGGYFYGGSVYERVDGATTIYTYYQMVSVDGYNFTEVQSALGDNWHAGDFVNDTWLLCGAYSIISSVAASANLFIWLPTTVHPTSGVSKIFHSPTRVIAVGFNSGADQIFYSDVVT